MSLTISDEVLTATQMSEAEMKREIAVMLYQGEKLTLAQASRLAEMSRLDFQRLLSSRGISLHYDEAELEQDLETLRSLGRL